MFFTKAETMIMSHRFIKSSLISSLVRVVECVVIVCPAAGSWIDSGRSPRQQVPGTWYCLAIPALVKVEGQCKGHAV